MYIHAYTHAHTHMLVYTLPSSLVLQPSKTDLNDSAVGEELSDEGVHEEEV